MGDAFILDPPQVGGGYLAGCLRLARVEKRLRPQQTANVIGPEGREG